MWFCVVECPTSRILNTMQATILLNLIILASSGFNQDTNWMHVAPCVTCWGATTPFEVAHLSLTSCQSQRSDAHVRRGGPNKDGLLLCTSMGKTASAYECSGCSESIRSTDSSRSAAMLRWYRTASRMENSDLSKRLAFCMHTLVFGRDGPCGTAQHSLDILFPQFRLIESPGSA